MNKLRKIILLFFFILALGGVVGLLYYHFKGKKSTNSSIQYGRSKVSKMYNFGDIRVFKKQKIIKFPAQVKINKGKVRFLIYLKGYKWLRSESAIVSESLLSNLQRSIALLDWKLWNDIWYKKNMSTSGIHIYVKWNNGKKEKKYSADKLIENDKEKNIRDFVFMGTPFLDEAVLEQGYSTSVCKKCPLYSIEKKFIKKRKYNLKKGSMPPVGKKVKIIIELE